MHSRAVLAREGSLSVSQSQKNRPAALRSRAASVPKERTRTRTRQERAEASGRVDLQKVCLFEGVGGQGDGRYGSVAIQPTAWRR